MKARRTRTIALPAYVQPRRLAGGKTGYWWYVPAKGRVRLPDGSVWPAKAHKLPDDTGDMIKAAERLHGELRRMRAGIEAPPSMREGTLGWLIRRFEASDLFKDKDPVTGEGLSWRTKLEYRNYARAVQCWSDDCASAQAGVHPTISDLDADTVKAWLDTYLHVPSQRRHLYTYMRLLLNFAVRIKALEKNPAANLRIAVPKRKKKLVLVGPDDVMEFVRAADEAGLDWLGTGVLIHFDLGQRQNDILALRKPENYSGGKFHFTQNKTSKRMVVEPFMTETRKRLDTLPDGPLVQRKGMAVKSDPYRRAFREIAQGLPAWGSVWETELRHCSIVYARRAGNPPEAIANRSGHSLGRTYAILEMYMVRDEELAEASSKRMADHRAKARKGITHGSK